MLYNFLADSVHNHTKKLCSRISSSEVQFYTENGLFAFLYPFGSYIRVNMATMFMLGSFESS